MYLGILVIVPEDNRRTLVGGLRGLLLWRRRIPVQWGGDLYHPNVSNCDDFSLLLYDSLMSELYFRESPNLLFIVSLKIDTWKFKANNISLSVINYSSIFTLLNTLQYSFYIFYGISWLQNNTVLILKIMSSICKTT